jgi:N4-(beta-N-acetylglucosaminyl)-L-asparaginase
MKKSVVTTANGPFMERVVGEEVFMVPAKDGRYFGTRMSHDRRQFLKLGSLGAVALVTACSSGDADAPAEQPTISAGTGPLVLSTWRHGMAANDKAWTVLQAGGSVLDAVEQGVAVVESDLTNRSVGLGGNPDRDGRVTLDACIQDHEGRAGAVAFVQRFEHPVSIARAIMERTPHVMLVGAGAEQWAAQNGFTPRDVEIPEVRQAWLEWLKTSDYKPIVNVENHDTIGMVAMDAQGRLAGSCTTSGMAYKIHGRVGDSPIIGAGLFVDGEVGAATATGVGELMIRTAASHTVVELMRQGRTATEACREAVQRILRKVPDTSNMQVGLLAIRKDGDHGGWSHYKGFDRAVYDKTGARMEICGFERAAHGG